MKKVVGILAVAVAAVLLMSSFAGKGEGIEFSKINLENKWLKTTTKNPKITLHIPKSKKETLQKLCSVNFFIIYIKNIS